MILPIPPATKNADLDEWLNQLYFTLSRGDISSDRLQNEMSLTGTQNVSGKTLSAPSISSSTFNGSTLRTPILTNTVINGSVYGDAVSQSIPTNEPSPSKLVTEKAAQDYISRLLGLGTGITLDTGEHIQFEYISIGSWDLTAASSKTLTPISPPATFTTYFLAGGVIFKDTGTAEHLGSSGLVYFSYLEDTNAVVLAKEPTFAGTGYSDTGVNRGYVLLGMIV